MTRLARVLKAGLQTTVQDGGRSGWRHLGVAHAGALDPGAAWLANRLIGNDANAAVLELTLRGPTLQFDAPARIALVGAQVSARFDGARVPMGRPVMLPAGTLELGALQGGARAWLAIDGGIDVPPVLGSRSTDLRGGFGGLAGRALRAGDVLPPGDAPCCDVDAIEIAPWWIDDAPAADPRDAIRVLPGADATAPADALYAHGWKVAAASNRQGLRLEGASLEVADGRERVSAPVAPGTVQLPPDGQPIVLLADAQTHGGYPRIGHVIRADRPRLAQLQPGDRLRFAPCTAEEAHAAWRSQQQALARLRLAIAQRRG